MLNIIQGVLKGLFGPMEEAVKSPCKAVCDHRLNNHCTGCGRTTSEAISWTRMTDPQKKTTLRLAKLRLRRTQNAC